MDEERKSTVNLTFSKARIEPKKAMSIPRLELMALLIGIRSSKFVSKEWVWQILKELFGQISNVLNWLKSKKPSSVFVKNRITEITNQKNIKFRYINTKDNPADPPSRGMSKAMNKALCGAMDQNV